MAPISFGGYTGLNAVPSDILFGGTDAPVPTYRDVLSLRYLGIGRPGDRRSRGRPADVEQPVHDSPAAGRDRYTNEAWLAPAQTLNDPLSQHRRDGPAAFLVK
jgi:hypothetical protein